MCPYSLLLMQVPLLIKFTQILTRNYSKARFEYGFVKTAVNCVPPHSGRQSQNGLIEHVWQMVIAMAQSYITDMQMPCVLHAIQVSNYLLSTVNGVATTSFELVHGVKPDYRVLFRLFSTGFFQHTHDSTHARDGFEAKMLQGIVIGCCRQSDGLLFYSPHTRQIYHSSDYKLDEG